MIHTTLVRIEFLVGISSPISTHLAAQEGLPSARGQAPPVGGRIQGCAAAAPRSVDIPERVLKGWNTLPRQVFVSFYLMRFGYTSEAWARLIKKPEDRREVARGIIEQLGGKLHGFWYGFGEHDGFVLIEAPSNVSAAAFAVGISAGGSLRSSETTVLLTVEETIDMLKKAQDLPYRAPGASS